MIEELRFPSSATVRAPERLVLKGGRSDWIDIPVRYGVFRHAKAGTCLIDTGYSRRVTAGRRSLSLNIYNMLLRPRLTPNCLPDAVRNVDTILITHWHADHISALLDYPEARIIADRKSLDHYLRVGASRLRHGVFAELLPDGLIDRIDDLASRPQKEAPLGLGAGLDVFGDGSVFAIPLPGHMRGHTGYCFARRDRPLLYAADAQWLEQAVMEDRLPGAPASWVLDNEAANQDTARRIRAFAESGGDVVYCHDPVVPPCLDREALPE
ncbi:MBL fold metallo-hydrolase [Maricaulis parjimensis]|uniref:MBL fold metallo-hydrolase n=1 Tax=Maricaulis parjimensis TaxID=144023 RepID=UPI00193A906B|nr:MBL fold metallo-hydrolase [Maricaulis parjimensis]